MKHNLYHLGILKGLEGKERGQHHGRPARARGRNAGKALLGVGSSPARRPRPSTIRFSWLFGLVGALVQVTDQPPSPLLQDSYTDKRAFREQILILGATCAARVSLSTT